MRAKSTADSAVDLGRNFRSATDLNFGGLWTQQAQKSYRLRGEHLSSQADLFSLTDILADISPLKSLLESESEISAESGGVLSMSDLNCGGLLVRDGSLDLGPRQTYCGVLFT